MSHADLIQAATDLLSEAGNLDYWLPRYDAALASGRDGQLARLVDLLAQACPIPSTRLHRASSWKLQLVARGGKLLSYVQ